MTDQDDSRAAEGAVINPFDEAFRYALRADPDVLIVGEASGEAKAILMDCIASGPPVYIDAHGAAPRHVRAIMDLYWLAGKYPAEAEVGIRMLRRDKNATLPARIRRLLKTTVRSKVYSLEEPPEYDLSQYPVKTIRLTQEGVADEA